MRASWWFAACLAAFLCAPAARAQGGPQPPRPGNQDEGLDPLERLKKIQALMEQVEGRLFEADTGEFTQTEQQKIVEAMRFEEKSFTALEELIHELEKKQGN